jgi:hypothetical protein
VYRLILRDTRDLGRYRAALGSAQAAMGLSPVDPTDPPGPGQESRVDQTHSMEFELLARPPGDWLQRRITDPAERDLRLVTPNGWWWFTQFDGVEYGGPRDPAPPVYRHLFELDALLALCEPAHVEPSRHRERPAQLMTLRPRPGVSPPAFPPWPVGAERFDLWVDDGTGIVVRAEARRDETVFWEHDVLDLTVLPDDQSAFLPVIGASDVLYRAGEDPPGVLVPLHRAPERARQRGVELLLPRPAPPDWLVRVWVRSGSPPVRVQVDLSSGRHVVLWQFRRADEGTELTVDGTATANETAAVVSALAPAAPGAPGEGMGRS